MANYSIFVRLPYSPQHTLDKRLFLPYTENGNAVKPYSSEGIYDATGCINLFGTTCLYHCFSPFPPKIFGLQLFYPHTVIYHICACFVVTSPFSRGIKFLS